MADRYLMVVVLLALGPLALMGMLYLAGLALKAVGRPGFLHRLGRRKKAAEAPERTEKDREC